VGTFLRHSVECRAVTLPRHEAR